MTPENFVYWLQGFVELDETESVEGFSVRQRRLIENHLKLVLENKSDSYDQSTDDESEEDELEDEEEYRDDEDIKSDPFDVPSSWMHHHGQFATEDSCNQKLYCHQLKEEEQPFPNPKKVVDPLLRKDVDELLRKLRTTTTTEYGRKKFC